MKMTKKIISLFVSLAMVCTMTSVSVFATGNGDNEGEQPTTDTQMTENIEDGSGDVDEDINEDTNVADTPMMNQQGAATQSTYTKLAAPTNVKVLAGYKSVKITWDRVDDADAYNVGWRKSGGTWKRVTITKGTEAEKKGLSSRTGYDFRVMAIKFTDEGKKKSSGWITEDILHEGDSYLNAPTSDPTTISKKNTVNRLRISFTMKRTKKANGKTLKKGSRQYAENFGLGKYTVYKGGKRLRVPRVMVKKISASYVGRGGWNYSDAEAEYFLKTYLKDARVSSSKKYTIWVSTYTQHLYVFKKVNGNWKVDRSWEIAMGKKTTPSPTGNKVIQKKVKKHHSIKWWNCYSSWNALHGFRSSWSSRILGRLASNGCVRNTNDKAQWIYQNCPKGTRVILY